MTDIAVRSTQQLDIPAGNEPAALQLAQWAQAADAAYSIATKLCDTQFAPAAYRRKPEEATAAILAGAEVGLSPMAALRAFDNIQGTPAPKALTLRAIVQSLGHRIEIVGEPNAQTVSVRGLRKGETDWQTSTWTIERAKQMGLLVKDQWQKQPTAMLIARATAEVCRWIASDAIMGMPYTVEEIRDHDGYAVEARPAPRVVTAAEILGTTEAPLAVTATDDAIAVGASAPWQPGEREEMVTADQPGITEPQKKRIFALLGAKGITDRDTRLAGISKVVGRQVASTNDLTMAEAAAVIDALEPAPEAA